MDKFICIRCGGEGDIKVTTRPQDRHKTKVLIKCFKCNGTGYVDWIENVLQQGDKVKWLNSSAQSVTAKRDGI